uniref:Uncharacterized protein n=1 Tax=Anguilla anguilla TaxID=7936 RepID=A0A0E9WWU0_ANGAN
MCCVHQVGQDGRSPGAGWAALLLGSSLTSGPIHHFWISCQLLLLIG